ncbi:hypothetical protein Q9L58_008862 [Maublancomyces gigas]|uniref:Small ribosomal subunit protein uS7 domain-containing protein n=1 Tax=Discina gigas TaxID=1032678 RepID=A0ABR3G8I0_9PEZI
MPPRTLFRRPLALRITARPIYIHGALLKCYSTGPGVPMDGLLHTATAGVTRPEIRAAAAELLDCSSEGREGAFSVLKNTPSKRSYSTSTTAETPPDLPVLPLDLSVPLLSTSEDGDPAATPTAAASVSLPLPDGAKFPLPTLPIPARAHLNHRYSPLLDQVTNFLMRHGKKATAQSNVTQILSILRTKPAPKPNAQTPTPLIAGTPPLSSLPSDPITYLQTAIDSVAPLMKITAAKGAGGTKDLIPSPLNVRQRRRAALEWICNAADKRKDRDRLAVRFADEIVSVVEGRSSVWEKRSQIHRQAIMARANVSTQPRRAKGKNTMKFPYK